MEMIVILYLENNDKEEFCTCSVQYAGFFPNICNSWVADFADIGLIDTED